MVLCLGIESTAHTFGASVVQNYESGSSSRSFRILSDVKDSYKAPRGSGIHPREAARHHEEVCSSVIEKALDNARIGIRSIDFISYSAGPGLGPCLRVGGVVTRTISSYFGLPMVAANHAIGHIELGKYLTGLVHPLVLLVSGGHTALVAFHGSSWKIFGETLDLTLGQLLDQFGRFLGLSSPAGREIELLSHESKGGNKVLSELPYTIKGNDVSYSGLLSSAKSLITEGIKREDVCFAVQEMAFSVLTEATERALAFTGNNEILLTGGVAANQRLSNMLGLMCKERGVKLGVTPRHYAGDCGAQIASAGFALYEAEKFVDASRAFTRQSWRIDQVVIN